MAFSDDINYFTETSNAFGVVVNWTTPALGNVNMLFDNAYFAGSQKFGSRTSYGETRSTSCTGAASDLTGVSEGSLCTIEGTDYEVKNAEPDGQGMIICTLKKA